MRILKRWRKPEPEHVEQTKSHQEVVIHTSIDPSLLNRQLSLFNYDELEDGTTLAAFKVEKKPELKKCMTCKKKAEFGKGDYMCVNCRAKADKC